jgi:hypothetical protein
MQEDIKTPDDAFSTVDESTGRTVTAGELAAVAAVSQGGTFDAASYNTIKSLIQQHLDKLDAAAAKQKEFKDMLNDVLLNDKVYQENVKKSEEINKAKSQTKQQLMKDPKVAGIVDKIREFGLQVKETRIALSEYLLQYQQIAGVNEIEDSRGEQREIVLNAKVK